MCNCECHCESPRFADDLLFVFSFVQLAGLLHDVGHGPFSHLWEGVVHQGPDKTCKFFPDIVRCVILIKAYFVGTHEQQSIDLIKHMMIVNNISLHHELDNHEYALKLITSLITADTKAWKELLKPEEMFITEIVSNYFCKIDVDKCDYILRDTHYVQDSVEIKPFIEFLQRARIVYDSHGTSHIGYHCEDFPMIENLFYNRAYLHMNIYQHCQVAGVEKMVKDICSKASAGGIKIADLPLAEVHRDCDAYLQLDDFVLNVIKQSSIDNDLVREAQKILERLQNGRLYNMVWESPDGSSDDVFNSLVDKFGSVFCVVNKEIPKAEVPSNVPLYIIHNNNIQLVQMASSLKLSYKSQMIFCVEPDEKLNEDIRAFIVSLNNNNI